MDCPKMGKPQISRFIQRFSVLELLLWSIANSSTYPFENLDESAGLLQLEAF